MVHDKKLIDYSLSTLLSCDCLERIVVMLSAGDVAWSETVSAQQEKIVTAVGGDTRAHSVLNGLYALEGAAEEDDWVLVHDAARPCLTSDMLKPLFAAVAGHPVGGLLGVPVVDTVKRVSFQGDVEKTLPRENIWLAQTPQIFRYRLLREALLSATEGGHIITDEASAMELAGYQPKMVLGDKTNIKVTRWEDVQRVNEFLADVEQKCE